MKNHIIITLTVLLTLSSCSNGDDISKINEVNPKIEIMTVALGGEKEFTVNGEVTPNKSANITSELRANVQNILVKPGDKVRRDQTLITLYSASIDNSLSTASSSLANADKSLSQTKESVQKNIEASKVALEKSELYLQNLLKQNKTKRIQAEEALNTAKLNLNLSTESATTALETSKINLENTINSSQTVIDSALNTIDAILGISEKYKYNNDSFEQNLGAFKSSSKKEAEIALEKVLNSYNSFSPIYESSYSILRETEDAAQKTLIMLNNSSTGNNFPETTLTSYIGSISGAAGILTSIRSTITSLSSYHQAVETAQKSFDSTIQNVNGSSQVTITAQVQYNSTIESLDASEDDAEKSVEATRIAYESALKAAGLSETGAKTSLTAASGGYQQAQINKDKLIIKAPFDGYIVDIPVNIGDEVNPGTLLTEIENNDVFKIIVYLTNSQVTKIKYGDEVRIGKKSMDKITAISSSVDPDIKKYKVEIVHKNPFLHSGQVIPVSFTVRSNPNFDNNVIYIPLVAVHMNADEIFVWKLDNENKTIKNPVGLGEIIGKEIAIKSGLTAGDRVIIQGGRLFKKEGIKADVLNETTEENIEKDEKK